MIELHHKATGGAFMINIACIERITKNSTIITIKGVKLDVKEDYETLKEIVGCL